MAYRVHSFHTLLADLATLARNTVVVAITPDLPLCVMTRPTPVQRRAFELLDLAPVARCRRLRLEFSVIVSGYLLVKREVRFSGRTMAAARAKRGRRVLCARAQRASRLMAAVSAWR